MMELAVEQRENQSKGYVHAGLMQEVTYYQYFSINLFSLFMLLFFILFFPLNFINSYMFMIQASATMEVGGRTSLETLKDAHESLLRKIADFKTIEKQIAEFETGKFRERSL